MLQPAKATVILVHGLWMSGLEMRWLGKQLKRSGFPVRYFHYKSRQNLLKQAADDLRSYAAKFDGQVHLVGHSLGGLVIASMLANGALPNLGRIVLLGSPQNGSKLAAALDSCTAGRLLIGPMAAEGIVHNRPATLAGYDLLVIAGTLPLGFGTLFGVGSPHDGTVAVEETRVPGARQILVHTSHMGMLFSQEVAAAITDFLTAPPD
ncbi:MAG: alpha/beta hydrolase [Geobacter sp.]|nr:alpha/beta hydrolase [Geobacter sp.]